MKTKAKQTTTATHVIKWGNGWAVAKEGTIKVSRVYDTKVEAVEYATTKVAKSGGDVIIHNKDGAVQEWKSYARS